MQVHNDIKEPLVDQFDGGEDEIAPENQANY